MRIKLTRYSLQIIPDDAINDPRDEIFIEEVLGLRKDGDSVMLTRIDKTKLRIIAYLETRKK